MPSWQDAAHFEGGAFGYLEGRPDNKAAFVRLVAIEEMADNNTADLTRAVIGPVDTFLSAKSIAQGRGTWGDGTTLAMAIPGFGIGKVFRAGKGPLPAAAKVIDQDAIREIERVVRAGKSAVPLNAGAQLRAVAESFANKVGVQVKAGNIVRAEQVRAAGLDALYRLDRFKVLTEDAIKQLDHIIRTAK